MALSLFTDNIKVSVSIDAITKHDSGKGTYIPVQAMMCCVWVWNLVDYIEGGI